MRVGDRLEMRVIRVAVLAAPGEGGDAVFADQSGRDVVLRGQRVRRRKHHLGAAGLERAHEIGRLGRDVQTRPDADALERPVALEPFADQAQHGHLALGPFDAADTLGPQAEVGHVVGRQDGRGGHRRSVSLRTKRRRNGAVISAQGGLRRWISRSSKRACSL